MTCTPIPAAALAVSLATFATPAGASGPASSGTQGLHASRAVGLWKASALVGPCGGTPAPISALSVFHAGGTLSETNAMPPAGIPNLHGIPGSHTRGPGYGTWSYDHRTGRYTATFRFNWFVNGFFHGYQVVKREMLMSGDRSTLAGPVRAARYLANGDKYADFCGTETATRL